MDVYPIYLRNLDQKKTVIVGGDEEAEGKVNQLLERNARLTVISPTLTQGLKKKEHKGQFTWIPRTYKSGDFEGAFMAIVAEFEGNINEKAYQEATERGILINVMDDIPHANFAFGSIVKQGPLTLSISTGGAAPALAVRLRQRFEKEFGPEYGAFLEFMQQLRKPMKRHHATFATRKELWYKLIDSDVFSLFRKHSIEEAHQKTAEIVGWNVVNEALQKPILT